MEVMMIGKRCLLFDPYEYTVMKYAYQFGKGKEFRISDMHAVLLSLERMKIGKYSTQSFLNQLAAKRVMKKDTLEQDFSNGNLCIMYYMTKNIFGAHQAS